MCVYNTKLAENSIYKLQETLKQQFYNYKSASEVSSIHTVILMPLCVCALQTHTITEVLNVELESCTAEHIHAVDAEACVVDGVFVNQVDAAVLFVYFCMLFA